MELSIFLHRLQKKRGLSWACVLLLLFQLMLMLPVQAESEPITLNMDLFEPYVLELEEAYIYVTSFGNYSFSKEDGSYAYTYLDGTKLCPSVKFDLQHLIGDSWEDLEQDYFSLRGLSNEHFAFSANVLNNSQLMGVLDVDCQFYREKAPKLSVQFRELEDCKPYRIVFKVTLPQAWRYFWHDQVIEMTQTQYKLKGQKRVRIYNQSDMLTPLNILIDWREFGITDCLLKGSTVRVAFPMNVEAVDPSTVAEVSLTWATHYGSQRKMFFAEGLWFVAYRAGTKVGYYNFKTSADGVSWSDPTNLGELRDMEFSWFYNGTYVHYVSVMGLTCEKLYYRAGQPLSNGSIQWLDALQEILDVGDAKTVSYVSIATDSSGYPFIIYYLDSPKSVKVLKSSWNNGTWSTEFDTELSTATNSHQTQIVPLTSNKMYALYQPESPREIYGKLWNGTAWEAEEQCTSEELDFWLTMSAVAINDDVHLVWVAYIGYDIAYAKRDSATGTWTTATILFDGVLSANRPCMSKAGSNLILFWDSNKKIYSKKLIAGQWQDTKELVEESLDIYTGSVTTAYEAGASHLAVVYTIQGAIVRFQEEGGLLVTLSASPEELETGQQTTVSWTVTYLNGTEVSSYTINITRDGSLILQDSSDSSLTQVFGSAGTHSYTCSGVTDGSMTAFESNSVSVEWTGEETKGEGTEDGFRGGSFTDQIQQVTKTIQLELSKRGLYWIAGLLIAVVIAGVYAGTKSKKVSRQPRGTTGGRSASPRGRVRSKGAQPRGVPKKRKRDARGRFV